TDGDGVPLEIMSHIRVPDRRMETPVGVKFFAGLGFAMSTVAGKAGDGGYLESGDAFPYADALLVGYGKRSDEVGIQVLATELGVRVRGLRIVHPAMYHLDLAFCSLDERTALVCPDAFD